MSIHHVRQIGFVLENPSQLQMTGLNTRRKTHVGQDLSCLPLPTHVPQDRSCTTEIGFVLEKSWPRLASFWKIDRPGSRSHWVRFSRPLGDRGKIGFVFPRPFAVLGSFGKILKAMNRLVASLPESVAELCLIRLGLVVHKLRALPFAAKMGRAIDRSAKEAIGANAGLLRSERFGVSWGHFGVLQYWASYESLETWSHRPPHSDWWREALERMRKQGDFGIYHETYLVPRSQIESIYLNCPPAGLSAFGVKGEAIGTSTTSRDRLGRRAKGS
jgi:hypothetical protein